MSKTTLFTGAGVAIVTPFDHEGRLDHDKYREFIEWQLEQGTDAIIACGTTGESSTLNHEEHTAVIRETVEQVNGRVPVIAGAGSNDTRYCIELANESKALGVDGLLLVTPYYNKTSQRGLFEHYTAVANAVKMPIILYNVPGRTGLDIKPDTYSKLADNPYIVGIKEANGNISSIVETASLCNGKIDLYAGNDDQVVSVLAHGGKGVISASSNVIPRQMHDIVALWSKGNIEASRDLQLKMLPVINALFSDVNPIPVKEALNMMGWDVGECRLPLYKMAEGPSEKLREILKAFDIIA